MTYAEVEAYLLALTQKLTSALTAEPFRLLSGYEIGVDLVRSDFASAEALGRTIEVVELRLLRDLELTTDDAPDRLGRLLGSVAAGYARALRDRTLDEQEAIRQAALWRASRPSTRCGRARPGSATRPPTIRSPACRTGRSSPIGSSGLYAEGNGAPGRCLLRRPGRVQGHQRQPRARHRRPAARRGRGRLGRRLNDGGHLVARMGGDEFVILVEHTTCTDDVIKVADGALAAIARAGLHRRARAAGLGQHRHRRAGGHRGQPVRGDARRRHHAELGEIRGQGPLGAVRPGPQRPGGGPLRALRGDARRAGPGRVLR